MSELMPDAEAQACLTVRDSDLATSLNLEPGDAFPPVFATSRMVALMEVAGARLLRPLLAPGELSVGVTVDITHAAATPVGVGVSATARYVGREGRLFVLEVTAWDAGGEIGRGTHKRAIISTERLLSGAARRNNPSAEVRSPGSR